MIIVENKSLNPRLNHAIELFLMDNFDEDIFMFWKNRPSILIGRFQNIDMEVNLEFTKKTDMDVVRRLSGGGAIYCDPGNMQYSFITKDDSQNVNDSFRSFAEPVVAALRSLGLPAEFSGRNDIEINGMKVSGNAQFKQNGKILHHGTLLYEANLYNLKNALKARDIKMKSHHVASHRARVGFIGDMIDMDINAFMAYIEEYIIKAYGIKERYTLSEEEMQAVIDIKEAIFDQPTWNYGERKLRDFYKREKHKAGLVELGVDLKDNVIRGISIEGDFFSDAGLEDLKQRLLGAQLSRQALEERLEDIHVEECISGMDRDLFITEMMKIREAEL